MSRILLVDEDELSRSQAQGFLRENGFEVVAAGSVPELEEALSRLQAPAPQGAPDPVLSADDLAMDRVRHRVTRGGEEIPLTLTEYRLLEFLLRHKNAALTRKDILGAVWGGDVDGFTNVVDVYVNYLRKKIEREGKKKLLKTVRGVGYMLEE